MQYPRRKEKPYSFSYQVSTTNWKTFPSSASFTKIQKSGVGKSGWRRWSNRPVPTRCTHRTVIYSKTYRLDTLHKAFRYGRHHKCSGCPQGILLHWCTSDSGTLRGLTIRSGQNGVDDSWLMTSHCTAESLEDLQRFGACAEKPRQDLWDKVHTYRTCSGL